MAAGAAAVQRRTTTAARRVSVLTLQCFPHVGAELAPALRPQVAVLVDEAHRSHADKALTEQLLRVDGETPGGSLLDLLCPFDRAS